MRHLRLTVPLVLVAAVAACDSGEDPIMPSVVGQQLDAALLAIDAAGIRGEAEVDGGGLFGIVDEANWEVCTQSPAAGEPAASAPQLTVDRACGDDGAESDEPAAEESTEAAAETADPTPEPTETAAEPEEVVEETITAENNADFAALLALTDDCSDQITVFAETYSGRTVEFDGNVAYINNHGDYNTRWDFLVNPGDYDPNSSTGPNFQFRDVGRNDLHLPDQVDGLSIGDNIHVVAEVGESMIPSQCLFLLDPVSTTTR